MYWSLVLGYGLPHINCEKGCGKSICDQTGCVLYINVGGAALILKIVKDVVSDSCSFKFYLIENNLYSQMCYFQVG